MKTSKNRRHEIRRVLASPATPWTAAALILFTSSVLAITMKPLLDGEVSSGLIFVLGITLTGARAGLAPAVLCAVLASAIFNFFLADPVLTFRISNGDDLAPPVIFTGCAVISGLLAGRLKNKTDQLGENNLQLRSLLETSRNLQKAANEDQVVEALKSTVPSMLNIQLGLYRLDDGVPVPVGDSPNDNIWTHVAMRTCDSDSEFLVVEGLTGYVLWGAQGIVGSLVADERAKSRISRSFMLALARTVALALERAHFASVIAEGAAQARTEELKSALLSSVSHDFRTPLTAISASASSLIDLDGRLDRETSRSLLRGIIEECGRLNRYTANLLELTRLQSIDGGLHGQILSTNDMARAVVQRVRQRFLNRHIELCLDAEDSLVCVDAALFELALTNIIQNALNYSDSEVPVIIRTTRLGDKSTVSVIDLGPGIPIEDQMRVFDRFYRGIASKRKVQGSGLGLAIAKGFVEAFDGSIYLISPTTHGAGTCVEIKLPIVNEPRVR